MTHSITICKRRYVFMQINNVTKEIAILSLCNWITWMLINDKSPYD